MHPVFKTYSTEAVPHRQKIDYWHSLLGDTFTSLESLPIERQSFSGKLQKAKLGSIGISEVCSTPCKVNHARSMISRETVPYFLVHMQLKGCSMNRQDGREALLEAGDFALCDSTRPYDLSFNDMNDMLVLRIPAKNLKRYMTMPEDMTCVRMDGKAGMSNFASTMLTGLWENFDSELDEGSQVSLSDVLLKTLSVAYGVIHKTKVAESSSQGVRRIQVRQFIENHLNRSDLTPALVANKLSMSVRYLHILFENEGETVNQFIRRRRLEEAKNQLADPRSRNLTISEIAYGLGFNHLTHFGRVFKAEFGISPKSFRAC